MGEARNRSKRRAKRGSRHEVRVWLGKDLYDRLSREAAARELNLSQCIRELLSSHFELQGDWSAAWRDLPTGGGPTDVLGNQTLLRSVDERLTSLIGDSGDEFASIDAEVEVVAAMIQQAYLGIVARLPPLPDAEKDERHNAARRALDAWVESVADVCRGGGAVPLAAVRRTKTRG